MVGQKRKTMTTMMKTALRARREYEAVVAVLDDEPVYVCAFFFGINKEKRERRDERT
jgi:hypothetical protein